MSKHKKTFTIFGLLAVALVLAGTVYLLSQPSKQGDEALPPDETAGSVEAGAINGDVSASQSAVTPDPAPITESELPSDGITGNDIPLTDIPDKPQPPDPPETAQTDDPHDVPADSALTDPNTPPDPAPQPAEPIPPADTGPQGGDTNSNGEVYIPGFGWVKDEGGGGEGEKSVGEGSLDKIIGH